MKNIIYIVVLWLLCIVAGTAAAQSPEGEGYTFITTERGPQICIGRWIPPRDVGLAGACDGQVMGLPQLSAISAKQTVDRLDQLLQALASIDQKLAVSNDQMTQFLQSAANSQTLLEQQVRKNDELLRDAINRRFADLPGEILDNEAFREELEKLKEDILGEVNKRYTPRPAPAAK